MWLSSGKSESKLLWPLYQPEATLADHAAPPMVRVANAHPVNVVLVWLQLLFCVDE